MGKVQLEARKYVGNYQGVGWTGRELGALCASRQNKKGHAHCAIARDQLLNVCVSVRQPGSVCVCVFEMRPHCVCDLRLAGIKIEFTSQGNWRVKKLAKGVRHVEVYNLYILYMQVIYTCIWCQGRAPLSLNYAAYTQRRAGPEFMYVNVTLALAQQIPIRSD